MPAPLLETPRPIVAAPMAGGPSTPALVTAVAEAGGFGFLAGGYQTPDALAAQIAEVRASGTERFGVNLFVPSAGPLDEQAFRAYAAELAPEAEAYGIPLDPEPVADDDHWREKLDLLLSDPVPVVSLTFGLPGRADVWALQRAGSRVLATVTDAGEAMSAAELGVDGLIVQGPAAGGHSATFDPAREITLMPTAPLVHEARSVTQLPVIAAGGVADGEDVLDLLVAGAEAAVIGTLLLRAEEAGTSPAHRAALADPAFRDPDRTATVITRAFTGRPARALRNGFTDRHPDAPVGYPAVHHLTRPLRTAAGKAGDTDRLHLWAGTGFRQAREVPAADIVGSLLRDL